MLCRKKKTKNKKKKTHTHFWGAGEQLYYFYSFGEHVQNNFREQRKIFSGRPVLFSGSKGVLISHGDLCETTKHLDCNGLMIHNAIEETNYICIRAIWAPSSEFVSSSIPSWQILTAHAQPFRGARDLAFCLKVPLDSLLVWASSEGSGETARMRRLAWTFAARICDKYQIRLTRSICH